MKNKEISLVKLNGILNEHKRTVLIKLFMLNSYPRKDTYWIITQNLKGMGLLGMEGLIQI